MNQTGVVLCNSAYVQLAATNHEPRESPVEHFDCVKLNFSHPEAFSISANNTSPFYCPCQSRWHHPNLLFLSHPRGFPQQIKLTLTSNSIQDPPSPQLYHLKHAMSGSHWDWVCCSSPTAPYLVFLLSPLSPQRLFKCSQRNPIRMSIRSGHSWGKCTHDLHSFWGGGQRPHHGLPGSPNLISSLPSCGSRSLKPHRSPRFSSEVGAPGPRAAWSVPHLLWVFAQSSPSPQGLP